MKILIMLLLAFMSTVAAAEEYGYPYSPYWTRDYYGNTHYYTPAQTQYFIDQQRIDNARQRELELQQYEADYERMRQYYKFRRDTERFIGD